MSRFNTKTLRATLSPGRPSTSLSTVRRSLSMIVIGWKSCLLWTAHTPCGVNSLRKSNQIKSTQRSLSRDGRQGRPGAFPASGLLPLCLLVYVLSYSLDPYPRTNCYSRLRFLTSNLYMPI